MDGCTHPGEGLMDAVEFLKERNRLCNSFRYNCLNCPAYNCANSEHFEETVALIEKWSKEHPIKTNAQKFEETYGFPPFGRCPSHDNRKFICPPKTIKENCDGSCNKCMAWWDQPYIEPKE